MAITKANLTSGGDATNLNAYPTASITPSANKLIIAVIGNVRGTVPATIPTLSGNGLTWVQIETKLNAAENRRITMFRAMGSSPSAEAITIDFGGVGQNNCSWSIFEFDGVDTTGTNGSGAVGQISTAATVLNTTSLDIILLTFGSVNDGTCSGFIVADNIAIEPDADAGWAEIHESQVNDGSGSQVLETQWNPGNDLTCSASWGSDESAAGIAFEIIAAGGGGGGAVAAPLGGRKKRRMMMGVGL